MLRIIARWFAKVSYIFRLEKEAGTSDINASLAQRNAAATRAAVEKLNAEADEIEASMKCVEAEEEERKKGEEYLKLTPQEKYEDEQTAHEEKQGVATRALVSLT